MDPPWRFDELAHAGEEHLDPERAASYDEKVPFDPSVEVALATEHGLSGDDTVVDLGCGTGEFALAVSAVCGRVVGVDASPAMLEVAREKRRRRDVDTVEFVHAGWLGYEHDGRPAAYVFSKNTLHHLPGFWKVEALRAVADILEDGGIFRLRDLVYSFDPARSHRAIASWLDDMASTPFTEEELHRHIRDEFSTYGFVLEEMLEQAGFEVLEATHRDGFYGAYTCRLTDGRR